MNREPTEHITGPAGGYSPEYCNLKTPDRIGSSRADLENRIATPDGARSFAKRMHEACRKIQAPFYRCRKCQDATSGWMPVKILKNENGETIKTLRGFDAIYKNTTEYAKHEHGAVRCSCTGTSENRLLRLNGEIVTPDLLRSNFGSLKTVADRLDRGEYSNGNLLIQGETTCGKTTVLHLIHNLIVLSEKAPRIYRSSCADMIDAICNTESGGHRRAMGNFREGKYNIIIIDGIFETPLQGWRAERFGAWFEIIYGMCTGSGRRAEPVRIYAATRKTDFGDMSEKMWALFPRERRINLARHETGFFD